MENKIYVSNVITTDVIKKLEPGKNYLIGSEMGSGKNFWERKVLLPYTVNNNQRVLLLTHRTQSLKQQENYLEDYRQERERQFQGGMFDLMSYQAFEKFLHRNDQMLSTYHYIVLDEAHCLVGDSAFNARTELIFNYLNQNDKAVKILMTGTYDGLYYLPWENKLEVLKEADYYNNNIKDLFRYEQDETVLSVVQNEVEKGNKVLVFHKSKETMSDFNIGNSKTLHSGNRENSLEFKQIATTQKFECDVLNTTRLMTEATEIKDDSVETIVINGISDIDTFVQAPARARVGEVNVYYKRISKRSIAARLRNLEKQLDYYDKFKELGEVKFVEEYGIDVIGKQMKAFYLDTVMDPVSHQKYTRLRIHNCGLAFLRYQYDMYEFMNQLGFEAFFEKYFPNIQYVDLEQLKREDFIQLDIVENYVDKKVFKDQQEELVNMICQKYGLRGKNGSTKIGMKTINSFFEENNIRFIISNKKESKGEHRNKMYWIINKIN
ncbi:DEAD/DEAH box helicase family protein [Peribacillus sp. AS_2]|uniref:DEAD/DEAH box helicase family protein n=1 Tax=Peribacillus sp. AS_2 TaxID=2996755 RepID=UPI0022A6DC34|nr:DEAD/DEAH box helicase family protein [Peribacillus sp. AS_2]MCZ0872772.1 DEAD/DEAH box helicase family protein [Peribacillus sp. AS_2]